jgi:hypothetical protein
MRLLMVGETAAELIAGRHTGRVLAVFRRAVYLSLPPAVLALVDRIAEPGPLHAHVEALGGFAVGDPVRADRGCLWVAGTRIGGAPDLWRAPLLPAPADLATAAATLATVVDHSPDLDLRGGAGPAAGEVLSATLRGGGLAAAAARLAGRGAGLTPAGDDVLAGLLLVGRSAAGPGGQTRLLRIAHAAASNEIARAYLTAAARGSSLAAVHDLINAGVARDALRARAARGRLARVGHTSGLDLAYGVLVGSSAIATAPWPDRKGW